MDYFQYIDKLKNSMKAYFDIFEDFSILDRTFPLYGKSLVRNERYIGSKKLVTDAYENYEYVFIQGQNENVEKNSLEEFINFLKSTVDHLIAPNEEHMSTVITGIYITNSLFTSEAKELGEKFNFNKNFFFGLKGWCHIQIVLVELNTNQIYTNKKGENLKPMYQAILK